MEERTNPKHVFIPLSVDPPKGEVSLLVAVRGKVINISAMYMVLLKWPVLYYTGDQKHKVPGVIVETTEVPDGFVELYRRLVDAVGLERIWAPKMDVAIAPADVDIKVWHLEPWEARRLAELAVDKLRQAGITVTFSAEDKIRERLAQILQGAYYYL